MGAWGPGSFQNDTALDFLDQVLRSESTDLVEDALMAAATAQPDPELDMQTAEKALAACEMVAAAYGRDSEDVPEAAREWIRDHEGEFHESMLKIARRAAGRVVSEIPAYQELWFDPAKAAAWADRVRDLATRLERAGS